MNLFEKIVLAVIFALVLWSAWTWHSESSACAAKGGVIVRGGWKGVCVKAL